MKSFELALIEAVVDRTVARIHKDMPLVDAFTQIDNMTVTVATELGTENYPEALQLALNSLERKLIMKGLRKFW